MKVNINLALFYAAAGLFRRLGSALALCLSVCLLQTALQAAPEPDSIHAGPLFDHFDLTLEPGQRTEILGPAFYREESGTRETWALPPLFSSTHDPDLELTEIDFLYPLLTYDRYGDQFRWQLFQLLSYAGGPTQTETNRNRFTIFPLFFSQRSSDPTQDYTAYGPFYGHLKNRLMRDEIFYVMFPLYSQTRKRDVVTDNYLYPFFHLRHGDNLRGWQFWPLYGAEHKGVTFSTNGFGDVSSIPGHERMFALWPIFAEQRNGLGSTNVQRQHMLLPFYNILRSPLRDATTVVWPFFSWIEDREKKYKEWEGPYPFVVLARGPGKTTTRFFPFFSQARSDTLESDFYLWPAYKYNRLKVENLERERTRLFFFLYSDTVETNSETKVSRRRTESWPFFLHRRDFNGQTRLQVLALLEPLTPGSHKIERDYSPIWALWRSEKNPATGANSQSLLWNLYRHEKKPEKEIWSAFFGLFQSQRTERGSGLRLFFIPVRKAP